MTEETKDTQNQNAGYIRRSAARLAAVQLLFRYESEEKNISPSDLISDLSTQLLENMTDPEQEEGFDYEPDTKFLKKLLQGTIEEMDAFDPIIAQHLSTNWSLPRLDPVWRALLRVAVFELKELPKTPAKVVINEYVDVAAAFGEREESSFINGILDKIAHELRASEF